MLSNKNDAKLEGRFVTRLDVLGERVDTLASAVATTASAMAKKDGEIASLRRELQARDEQIQALAARTPVSGGADPRELRELQQAVAALTNERTKQGSSKQLDELVAKVGLLGQRLDSVSTTVSTTAAGLAGREGELATIRKRLDSAGAPSLSATAPVADPALKRRLDELETHVEGTRERLDGQSAELEALKMQTAKRDAEAQPPSDELRGMLAALRTQVESLAGLRAGMTEEALNDRLSETDGALAALSERVDALSAGVESATARLSDKEHELAALHQHFLDSSSRIESIVGDLREALGAFPETDPDALGAVSAQLETASASLAAIASRVERLEATRVDELVTDLAERIDHVDKRVATVATEITRAKTLWPVALRSLEARLDDVAPRRNGGVPQDDPTSADEAPAAPGDEPDDLLADLRDSLRAMENVAAEMERASDGWTGGDARDETTTQQAVAGGARVVPLRTGDP